MIPKIPSQTPPFDPATLEVAATAWLIERDDGFTPQREREFARWLRVDQRHAEAVARLDQTVHLLKGMPEFRRELTTAFRTAAAIVPFPRLLSRPRNLRLKGIAWAAAATLAVCGVMAWSFRSVEPEMRYATTVAGYQRAQLEDGSTLELNGATRVRVRFSADERYVQLDAGEANFVVAKDTARPFVVHAGDVALRAVGTAFNVRHGSNGAIEVIVTEGRVRVSSPHAALFGGEETSLVSAGERLHVPLRAGALTVERVSFASLREALRWQSILVEFADVPLGDVVARFNTRSQLQLVVDDPELASRRIGGTFALDQAEAFVRLLERDGAIVGERRNENEIHLRLVR
jgi:transmembrane sensor